MANKKREQTLDFVEGLLYAADEIDAALQAEFPPRETLHGKFDIAKVAPEEIREMGKYQGRVVLVSLAAELALKFAWEQENPGQTASNNHNLEHWFKQLSSSLKKSIEREYLKFATQPKVGWKTANQTFKKCKDSSLDWRYIVEEGHGPQHKMQATYLKHATMSVITVTRGAFI